MSDNAGDWSDTPPDNGAEDRWPEADVFEPASEDLELIARDVSVVDEGELQEIGNPEILTPYWRQQTGPNDCALYAQGGVLEADNQPFDIDQYREQGTDEGWYTPEDGTYLDGLGRLMEKNGVDVTRYDTGATLDDLANELEQGHGVVVAVDTELLWGQSGGHAIWVTGLEVSADDIPVEVVCNDPGRPDGQGIHYPFEAFQASWDALGNVTVATAKPLSAFTE